MLLVEETKNSVYLWSRIMIFEEDKISKPQSLLQQRFENGDTQTHAHTEQHFHEINKLQENGKCFLALTNLWGGVVV